MNITKYISRIATRKNLISALLVAFGLFMFVYGGYDDSPGAQGLGLLMVGAGLWRLIRK